MKKNAIKLNIMYPEGHGKTFDMDYYCNQHIPMVKEMLGGSVIGSSVEEGCSGIIPGTHPTYRAIGTLVFEGLDVELLLETLKNLPEIAGDIKNFTNIKPVFQISKVIL